jgi:hypothetical protein
MDIIKSLFKDMHLKWIQAYYQDWIGDEMLILTFFWVMLLRAKCNQLFEFENKFGLLVR